MDGIGAIVDHLQAKGVLLSIEDGELRCRASRTAATPDVRNLIATLRPGIIRRLSGAEGPAEDALDFEIGPLAPVQHRPPPGCIGPIACGRLGACDRHQAGRPCLASSSERAA